MYHCLVSRTYEIHRQLYKAVCQVHARCFVTILQQCTLHSEDNDTNMTYLGLKLTELLRILLCVICRTYEIHRQLYKAGWQVQARCFMTVPQHSPLYYEDNDTDLPMLKHT